jgi:iron-sulfur cluster insertion protein
MTALPAGLTKPLIFLHRERSKAEPAMADGGGETPEKVTLTESAARRVAFLKQQENVPDAFLRLAVSGGGCSGFQYGFSFDDKRGEDDVVFERGGVALVVDAVSLELVRGAEIDFVEDMMGASFQVRNPNAASSCGCGNSFSIG